MLCKTAVLIAMQEMEKVLQNLESLTMSEPLEAEGYCHVTLTASSGHLQQSADARSSHLQARRMPPAGCMLSEDRIDWEL